MSNGKRAARRSNANIVIRRHSKHHRNYLKARAHGNSCFVVVPERQKTAGWVLTTSSGTVNGWVESGRAARSKSYNDDLVRLEKAAARNTAQTGKVDRLPSGCGTMRGERVEMGEISRNSADTPKTGPSVVGADHVVAARSASVSNGAKVAMFEEVRVKAVPWCTVGVMTSCTSESFAG